MEYCTAYDRIRKQYNMHSLKDPRESQVKLVVLFRASELLDEVIKLTATTTINKTGNHLYKDKTLCNNNITAYQ